MEIFSAIVSLLWIIFLGFWLVSAFGAKKNATPSKSWVVRLAMVIVIVALFQLRAFEILDRFESIFYYSIFWNTLGVLLTAGGVALAVWSRVHIGRNWGMPMSLKLEPELVTSGPYKHIRHPIYTGVLLALLGSAFVTGVSWFIPFFLFLGYFAYSATVEERMLLRAFPHKYPEYKKNTYMMIPYLW